MVLDIQRFVAGFFAVMCAVGLIVSTNIPVQAGYGILPCHNDTFKSSFGSERSTPPTTSLRSTSLEDGHCGNASVLCNVACQMVHLAIPLAATADAVPLHGGRLMQRRIHALKSVSHVPPTGPPKAEV